MRFALVALTQAGLTLGKPVADPETQCGFSNAVMLLIPAGKLLLGSVSFWREALAERSLKRSCVSGQVVCVRAYGGEALAHGNLGNDTVDREHLFCCNIPPLFFPSHQTCLCYQGQQQNASLCQTVPFFTPVLQRQSQLLQNTVTVILPPPNHHNHRIVFKQCQNRVCVC